MAWPPPVPPIDPLAIMPVLPHPGAEWWRDAEARAAERHSEAERVAAFYKAQERARVGDGSGIS